MVETAEPRSHRGDPPVFSRLTPEGQVPVLEGVLVVPSARRLRPDEPIRREQHDHHATPELVPLQVADAEEMAGVLGDTRLHEFIGGQPATIAALRVRYASLVAGSPDPDEVWLNRIVRRRSDEQPIGTFRRPSRPGTDSPLQTWRESSEWTGRSRGSRQRLLER
jgi:hypothetical protein